MHLFPTSKILISFGPFTITWYAALILAGTICTYFLCQRTMKRWGYTPDILEDYLFPLLIAGILGARIYYVLFEWHYYSQYPNEIFSIWNGGLAIHGGLITGLIFSYFYFKKKQISFLRMFDLILPNVLIAQAFGRWGNFANQEAYGNMVSASYYRWFPDFIKKQMFINGVYHHPTFLYESCMNLLGFIFITFLFRKFLYRHRGDGGFMYMVWYGSTRFVVEGMRTDSLMAGHFRMAQIVSIVFVGIGLLGLSGLFHRMLHWYSKPVILFDHDGTLVATKEVIFRTWDILFDRYAPDHDLTLEEKESFFGPPVSDVLVRYFPDRQMEDLLAEYITLNRKLAKQYIKKIPQVQKTVHKLHLQGYKLGVVSNKQLELIKNELQILGIYNDFDVIIDVDQCPIPKPDASGLICACEAMYLGHDDLIFVGDSKIDIQAARNMAAYSIGFSVDMQQKKELVKADPCRIIHDFSELNSIVKEKRAWCDSRIW